MMLSLGTPMILGGDEIGRTQRGNNNAYCQDSEISWYDWSLLKKNAPLYRFVKMMIAFRLRHPGFMRPEFYTGRDGNYNAIPDISWFDEAGETPDWETIGPCIAFRMDGSKAEVLADQDDNDFFIMFNGGDKTVDFEVAAPPEGKYWMRTIDTSFSSPDDILEPGNEKELENSKTYQVKDHSIVVLLSKVK
jgi:glycogen operon protein